MDIGHLNRIEKKNGKNQCHTEPKFLFEDPEKDMDTI